ncbi:MAG: hydrogenase maturation nickel metallochaperone HypA [Kiritimatiellae bacterium]|nr:hydrogenase maturation nickel metallochaperone HypA [Kiritimatiellia bacterium]
MNEKNRASRFVKWPASGIVRRVHEFSITQTIVQAVLAELKKVQPSRLVRARIVAGRLHQLVPATLTFAYEVLTKDTAASGSVLSVRNVPITAECRQCHWRGEIRDALFACGRCKSGDIEITGGRELYLDSIEVEQP